MVFGKDTAFVFPRLIENQKRSNKMIIFILKIIFTFMKSFRMNKVTSY